jgi:hypothetical protein
MSNKQRKREGGDQTIVHPITAGVVVAIGDCVGLSSGKALAASDNAFNYATNGIANSLAGSQEFFHDNFIGVSRKARRSTDLYTDIVVDASGVFEFDCASASLNVGDLVGMAANGTADGLESQKVVKVATENLAIGRVYKATTSAVTVYVKIFSALVDGGAQVVQ